MEFFDKKQDVLDIELTSYGKQLLSRGLFKPAYYSFSDDGVMYDAKWMSGSTIQEQQSQVEPRIQEETPRMKTQTRKVGAERGIFNYTQPGFFGPRPVVSNIRDLFEVFDQQELMETILQLGPQLHPQFAESEKLLENVLGTKSYFNDFNPAWNALFYNGNISSTTKYYKKNDITTLVPQLNCTLEDTVYKMDNTLNPYVALPEVKNIQESLNMSNEEFQEGIFNEHHGGPFEEIVDSYFQEFNLSDGNIFIVKDFLFFSLEEANVEYTNDNFMIEVFKVTTKENADNGEEELQKLSFSTDEIPLIISVDEEITPMLACSLIGKDKTLKDQNIYNTNVYDCNDVDGRGTLGTNKDPYGNLPPVNVGDIC